jgi:hypothetical protein
VDKVCGQVRTRRKGGSGRDMGRQRDEAASSGTLSRLVYIGSKACVSERGRPNTANPEDLV